MQKRLDLSRLLAYAGRRRYLMYVSWALSALSALIAVVPFWCVWRLMGELIPLAGLSGNSAAPAARGLPRWGWRAVGFSALSMTVYIAGLMCSHLAAFRIASNIRMRLLRHIASLPLGTVERFGSGRLRRTVIETSGAAETYLAHQLPDKYGALAAALGSAALLLSAGWRLALLSLLPIILGFSILARMTGRGMQDKMAEYQDALGRMSNEATGYVRGIPVVKTFGQTVFSFSRFREAIEAYERWVLAYADEMRPFMMGYTLAVNSIFIFATAAGLLALWSGMVSSFLLDLILVIVAAPLISVTLTRTMRQGEQEMTAADALRRIDEVLAMRPIPSAAPSAHPAGAPASAGLDIEFQDVSFSYDNLLNDRGDQDGAGPALSHVSLSVKAGRTVALVGPSGGGKSTLARLAARFFNPQEGRVLVGGRDVKDIPIEEAMRRISFVFQDSRLVRGSILDNVRMARPGAPRGEVLKALSAAQCEDILGKFPDGIEAIIGPGGARLSGGEAQRLCVARAILKGAPVIVLDEATAFADPDNERRMQSALSELARDRTVILIAHRLSTVTGADRICVLREGRIVEEGSFEELAASGGLFSRMWEDYRRSADWKVGAR